jgi:hypothetical protein
MAILSTARSSEIGLRRSQPSVATAQFYPLFLVAIIFLYFLLSTPALLLLGWHYIGGGTEIEKIHPATYLLFGTFSLSLIGDRHLRSRVIMRAVTDRALLAFTAAVIVTTAYCCLVQSASVSPFIDTFAVAILTTIIVTCVPVESLTFLRRLIDVFFLVNIVMIFWEAASHTTFFPNYLIGIGSPSEAPTDLSTLEAANFLSRPTGLFGHPLSAAMLLGVYCISTLASLPAGLSRVAVAKLVMALLAYGAIFSTASRSSSVTTTVALLAYLLYSAIASGLAGRISKASIGFALWTIVLFAPVCLVLWSIGFFDAIFYRFQFDYGSAMSRDYALTLVNRASTSDLWFGRPQPDVLGLQRGYGLIAIEISWVNFILVGGLLTTIPLFVTYFAFLFRSMRLYCVAGIYSVSLLVFVATSTSNGIWAKDTSLAAGLAIAISFLRRDIFSPGRRWPATEKGGPHRSMLSRYC